MTNTKIQMTEVEFIEQMRAKGECAWTDRSLKDLYDYIDDTLGEYIDIDEVATSYSFIDYSKAALDFDIKIKPINKSVVLEDTHENKLAIVNKLKANRRLVKSYQEGLLITM